MQVRTGDYHLQANGADLTHNLLTLQMLGARPTPSTTLSLGYYDGPLLGVPFLSYRSWGYKPPADTDVWTAQVFCNYREFGGELTQQVGKHTKLVLKAYSGAQQDSSAQSTTGYGIEQHIGTVVLLGGYQNILTPAAAQPAPTTTTPAIPTTQQQLWWQLNLPRVHKLPEWAAGALHFSVFDDGAQWGIGLRLARQRPIAGWSFSGGMNWLDGVPLQALSCQMAQMLNARTVFQAGYAQNPMQTGALCAIDQSSYHVVYLGYQSRPRMLFFFRDLGEDHPTQPATLYTHSLGLLAQLSPHTRFQVQADVLDGVVSGAYHTGLGYTFEFQRNFSDTESLSLKYRLCPSEFNTLTNHVGVEIGFHHTF